MVEGKYLKCGEVFRLSGGILDSIFETLSSDLMITLGAFRLSDFRAAEGGWIMRGPLRKESMSVFPIRSYYFLKKYGLEIVRDKALVLDV